MKQFINGPLAEEHRLDDSETDKPLLDAVDFVELLRCHWVSNINTFPQERQSKSNCTTDGSPLMIAYLLGTQISVVHPKLLTENGCVLPEERIIYSEDREIIRRPIVRMRLSGFENPSYLRDVARLTCPDDLRVTRDHALRYECQLRQG